MTGELDTIAVALSELRKHLPVAELESSVPAKPGLYAVHGNPAVWRELGLGEPPDLRPLYVGKAERSLAARDIRTHFRDGRTGSSTLRRSLAALLRDELGLTARPRNPEKGTTVASFALSAEDDKKLTCWMRLHLRLAVWAAPDTTAVGAIERAVLERLEPPLNLKDVPMMPWRKQLIAARAAMVGGAKAWAKAHPGPAQ